MSLSGEVVRVLPFSLHVRSTCARGTTSRTKNENSPVVIFFDASPICKSEHLFMEYTFSCHTSSTKQLEFFYMLLTFRCLDENCRDREPCGVHQFTQPIGAVKARFHANLETFPPVEVVQIHEILPIRVCYIVTQYFSSL